MTPFDSDTMQKALAKLDEVEANIKKKQKLKCGAFTKYNMLPKDPKWSDHWPPYVYFKSTGYNPSYNFVVQASAPSHKYSTYQVWTDDTVLEYKLIFDEYQPITLRFDVDTRVFTTNGTFSEKHPLFSQLAVIIDTLLKNLEMVSDPKIPIWDISIVYSWFKTLAENVMYSYKWHVGQLPQILIKEYPY